MGVRTCLENNSTCTQSFEWNLCFSVPHSGELKGVETSKEVVICIQCGHPISKFFFPSIPPYSQMSSLKLIVAQNVALVPCLCFFNFRSDQVDLNIFMEPLLLSKFWIRKNGSDYGRQAKVTLLGSREQNPSCVTGLRDFFLKKWLIFLLTVLG